MNRMFFSILLLAFLFYGCTSEPDTQIASSFHVAGAPESGLHTDSLLTVSDFLQEAVDLNKIPGAVITIVQNESLIYEEAIGWADIEEEEPMQRDHIFRMASMTKPVTSVAILMLAEEGKLNIDDPISDYIPEFSGPTILEDVDMSDTTWTARPAETLPTIHHLLTHTSGVAYGFINEQFGAIYQKAGVPDGTVMDSRTIEQTMSMLGELPLKHEPGSAWTYGLSTDILGRIVEVASGMPLDQYFQKHIFEPLGMNSTGFNIPSESQNRIVALYRNSEPNRLDKISRITIQRTDTVDAAAGQMPKVEYFSGGSGLFGTAMDYQRFLQTILNDGRLSDVVLFSEETARYLKENQIGELRRGADGFSYAFQVTLPDGELKNMRKPGRLQWGGLFQTHFWIDPARNTTVVLMTQVYPSMHQQEIYDEVEHRINRAFTE